MMSGPSTPEAATPQQPQRLVSFEETALLARSVRQLPPYEQTNQSTVFPHHKNLRDPGLKVFEFTDCIVSRDGFLRLPGGETIVDLGYKAHLPRGIKALDAAAAQPETLSRIDEPVILVGGHNNYYHWHINWLPRVMLADRFSDLREVPLLIHALPTGFVAESLKLVTGRDVEETHKLTGEARWLSRVFVPAMFLNPLHAPFALRGYERQRRWARDRTDRKPGRRLYISRSQAHARRVLNEAAVEDLLTGYGFETLRSETMTYQDQIAAFSDASFVIGAHGAGLTNVIFCDPGVDVIELSNAFYTRIYWSLSQVVGARHYRMLRSDEMVRRAGDAPLESVKNEDFEVDLDKLRGVIETFLNADA